MLDNIIKNHLYNSWLKFKKYLYFTKKGYDMKTNKKELGKEQNTKIESEKTENNLKQMKKILQQLKTKKQAWMTYHLSLRSLQRFIML